MIGQVTATIDRALRDHGVLELDYVDRHGEERHLEVEPYGFGSGLGGHLILRVWDVHGGGFEELVAGRIFGVADTGRRFEPRTARREPDGF